MKHIYLDKLFLFFLLIIILTGNFNTFLPHFILLIIHESGHAITGILLGYQLDKITIYPYGGVTTFNLPINIPLKKEFLILIMGPLMQVVGYVILKNYFNDIEVLHYTLLIFNLLPIYPLDGGKIFNILCNYSFNYLRSFYITVIVSIIGIIFLFYYHIVHYNLNMLMMLIVLLIKIIEVYKKRYYYYNRLLLERFLYSYSFSKIKYIKSMKEFYRDREHFINYQYEKKVLNKYFNMK